MLTTSAAKIFLASEREHTETESFRRFNSFRRGQSHQERINPVGPLYALTDETLAAGGSVRLKVEEDTLVVLLPIAGAIEVTRKGGESSFVMAGQSHVLFNQAGKEFVIRNPFEDSLVNYLQLWFRCPAFQTETADTFCFNIDGKPNQLIALFPPILENGFSLQAVIGKFNGRGETVYPLSSNKNSAMAFVIEGAFELENRLLEARDGLAVWNTAHIDMEALSNNAILLLVELG